MTEGAEHRPRETIMDGTLYDAVMAIAKNALTT